MIIGACGFVFTGSGAITDLLKEYEEIQVMDRAEFVVTYAADMLEDLEYHVCKYSKSSASVLAIRRFRKRMRRERWIHRISNGETTCLTHDFLRKITQVEWLGFSGIDYYTFSTMKMLRVRSIRFMARLFKMNSLSEAIWNIVRSRRELSVRPSNFLEAAKEYVSDILDVMGRDNNKITVLDQPFEACDPVKSFKFFEGPRAIIVDRDPRDHYLFAKCFLSKKMLGGQIPFQNVDDYIIYHRLMHQEPPGLRDRDDILYMRFEELIYDYENAVKKIADFCGVKNHIHRGEYFQPKRSRNNTQLFKKFRGFEEDIAKIEKALPEYLFHFENYPDIESEGAMFI